MKQQEIERKFLVTGDGWRGLGEAVLFRQGYIARTQDRTVRVRVAGEKGFLTIKYRGEGIARSEFEYDIPSSDEFSVEKDEEENVWYVTGGLVDLLERNVVLSDPDSMAYFQKVLKDKGVIRELKRQGVQEDDTVVVGGVEFAFKE